MKKGILKKLSAINILVLILTIILPALYYAQKAEASGLTVAMIRTDRMLAATATTGTVCARPTSIATEAKVVITFPSTGSWTVGASGTWTIDNTYTAGWPGSPTPTAWTVSSPSVAGQAVTFTSPDLTVGTTYCFNWNLTTALTTGTAGDNQIAYIETQTAGNVTIDKSAVALSIVNGSSAYDQITVTGIINPTFSFSMSANTANFTSIGNSVSNTETNPIVTITTNARNGWVSWVKDDNNGTLNSAGTSTNIPSAGSVGSNYDLNDSGYIASGGFGLGVITSGGSSSPTVEYDGSTAGHVGALSNSFRMIAYSTSAAAANTITLYPRAIASTTQAPALDYTDTLTVIAAGQF